MKSRCEWPSHHHSPTSKDISAVVITFLLIPHLWWQTQQATSWPSP